MVDIKYAFLKRPKGQTVSKAEGESFRRFASIYGEDAEDVAREAYGCEQAIAALEADRAKIDGEILALQAENLKPLSPSWRARQRKISDLYEFDTPYIDSEIKRHKATIGECLKALERARRDKSIADNLAIFDATVEHLKTASAETVGPAFAKKLIEMCAEQRKVFPSAAHIPGGAPFLEAVVLRDHAHEQLRLFHRIDSNGTVLPTVPGGVQDRSRKVRGIVEGFHPDEWIPHWQLFAEWRPIVEQALYKAWDYAESLKSVSAGDGRQAGDPIPLDSVHERRERHRAAEPILGTPAWDVWSLKAQELDREAAGVQASSRTVRPPEPMTSAEKELLLEQTRAQLAALNEQSSISEEI